MARTRKRTTTLLNILMNEETILSDSNVIIHEVGNWWRKQTVGISTFSQLNPHSLKITYNHALTQENWWLQNNVYTVPKVAREVGNFKEAIKKKLKTLSEGSGRYGKAESGRLASVRDNHIRRTSKQLFQDIATKYCRLHRLTRKSSINTNEELDALFELVVGVGQNTDAKRDFSHRYGYMKDDKEDAFVDEQLVAAAFYNSIFENKPVSIVSPDSDIHRLARYTHEVLLMNTDEVNVQDFLAEFPIKAYFIQRNQRAQLAYDSSKLINNTLEVKPELTAPLEEFWAGIY